MINLLFKQAISNSFIKVFCLLSLVIIMIYSNPSQNQALESFTWKEVKASELGHQWWDETKLQRTIKGNIRVFTKFDLNTDNVQEVNDIYTMEINCEDRLFRDTHINGIPETNSAWFTSEGDELIDNMINDVCSAKTI